MATTTVSDAAVFPQAKGTGLGSETSPVDAAGEGLLSQYHGKEYHTLSVSSRDGTNNTITLSAGIAFIEDDSSSTGGSRGSGGNPQLQSTTSSGYDTEVPENTVYVVVLPTTNTIDVADASTSQIWLNITSVTSQNSVEIRSDGGGGTTAEPSDTYLKVGDFNPDDSGADSFSNTDAGHPDSQALADGLVIYVGATTGRQAIDPSNTNQPIFDAIEAIYANNEGGKVFLPPGNIDHVGGSTPSGRSEGWIMRPGISVVGLGGQNTSRFATKVTRTSAGDMVGWGTDAGESVVTTGANLSGFVLDMDYKNLSNATGRGLVFASAGTDTYNNWVRDIRIENVGDAAIMQDSNTYATTFGPNLNVRDADPDNASAGRAIVQFTSGGVGHSFMGTCELYGDTSPASGVSSHLGMNLSGGWELQDMRFGGLICQPLNHAGRELIAGRLYAEPNPPSAVTVNWMFGFDEGATSSAGGGVTVGNITIGDGGNLTVDNGLVRLSGFQDSEFGPARLPYVADRSTLTNNGVQVFVRTGTDITPGVVYDGPASEVDNDASTFTNPVVCLGDLTLKKSTGTGYDGGTNDSQVGSGGSGAMTLIESQSPSAAATADFTTGIDSTYDTYQFEINNLVPATDNVQLHIQTSTDGGATWDSAASDYAWTEKGASAGANFDAGSAGDSKILIDAASGIGSAAGEGLSGSFKLRGPSNASIMTQIDGRAIIHEQNGDLLILINGGTRLAAEDVDAVRFAFSSGNIESGDIDLYGLNSG